MDFSRRDLSFLLPALMAGQGQTAQTLSSRVYRNDQIPYHGDQAKKSREFFNGREHSGFRVELHETVLGPGMESHPPHQHEHEEIIIVVEGEVEAYLGGKTESAPAGSVIYFGPNQMHNSRNRGTITCRYYVIELRGSKA